MAKGGRRPGSGRPKGSISPATAMKRELASQVLHGRLERRLWKLYLDPQALAAAGMDKNIAYDAFKFAKGYKSGKPKESIEMHGSLVDTLRQSLEEGIKRIEREHPKKPQATDIAKDSKKNEIEQLAASGFPN